MSTSVAPVHRLSPDTLAVLRRLAALQRPSVSDGERAAAAILAGELTDRGARVRVEPERVHGTYWVPIGISTLIAALAGVTSSGAATGLGLLTALSIADDLDIGRRPPAAC